jgi:tripartite-type tricarboxylate transporter receptor subunit TctC
MTATSFATNVALAKRLPYDPQRSFAPVALVATGTLALVVAPTSPAKTIKEFVELVRAKPGALNYASTGNGTVQHLTMELLKQALGIELVHVPYKANTGAITDVAGGHVEAMITPVHTAGPLVKQSRLRVLAVPSAERSPVFPSVPTLKEEGFPDLEVEVWYAMLAPAGTPQPVVAGDSCQQPSARCPRKARPVPSRRIAGTARRATAYRARALAEGGRQCRHQGGLT